MLYIMDYIMYYNINFFLKWKKICFNPNRGEEAEKMKRKVVAVSPRTALTSHSTDLTVTAVQSLKRNYRDITILHVNV